MKHCFCSIAALALIGAGPVRAAPDRPHDVVIRNGIVYDGSGSKPYAGDLAIDGHRISYVGPHRPLKGRLEIDVKGLLLKAASAGWNEGTL